MNGRSITRISIGGMDGYNDVGDITRLNELDCGLRTILRTCRRQIIYDKDAVAYTDDQHYKPRTEPVMLHRWKGQFNNESPNHREDQYSWDMEGLKVIVRGRGELQSIIEYALEVDPEDGSTEEYKTYIFGCKNKGIAELPRATLGNLVR